MKKNVRLICLALLVFPSVVISQTFTWPFLFSKPRCTNMPGAGSNCTKWVVTDNGDWNDGSTWNGGTIPQNNDIVCIVSGITVKVNNPTYDAGNGCPTNTSVTPNLYIFVCGTIDFKAGGKLNLGCNSAITIYPGGTVLAANGNSDQIQIGPNVVWGGNNINLSGPYSITGTGQGAGLLPVTLLDFNAQLKTPFEVIINWRTGSEVNSKEFVVERSNDARSWQSLNIVAAKGNSFAVNFYDYIDKSPEKGINYYRLKQIDATGSFEYSAIVRITNRNTGKIVVYPNPVNADATLYSGEVFTKNQLIQLFDVNGSLLQTLPFTNSNTLRFSTSKLSPGLYLVRITEAGKTIAETKLMKQ